MGAMTKWRPSRPCRAEIENRGGRGIRTPAQREKERGSTRTKRAWLTICRDKCGGEGEKKEDGDGKINGGVFREGLNRISAFIDGAAMVRLADPTK